MHEYSVQPPSHVISLAHPPLEARIPAREDEAENDLMMSAIVSQEPQIDNRPPLVPSDSLETLWLDLTVEVPKQWFVDIVGFDTICHAVRSVVAPLLSYSPFCKPFPISARSISGPSLKSQRSTTRQPNSRPSFSHTSLRPSSAASYSIKVYSRRCCCCTHHVFRPRHSKGLMRTKRDCLAAGRSKFCFIASM